jgi:hypothetical protein
MEPGKVASSPLTEHAALRAWASSTTAILSRLAETHGIRATAMEASLILLLEATDEVENGG